MIKYKISWKTEGMVILVKKSSCSFVPTWTITNGLRRTIAFYTLAIIVGKQAVFERSHSSSIE